MHGFHLFSYSAPNNPHNMAILTQLFMSVLVFQLIHAEVVVLEADSISFPYTYSPPAGSLVDAEWFITGTDGSSSDRVLLYDGFSDTLVYGTNYDAAKVEHKVDVNSVELTIHDLAIADVSNYAVTLLHGDRFEETFAIDILVPRAALDDILIEIGDDTYSSDPSVVNTLTSSNKDVLLKMPDGYSAPFSMALTLNENTPITKNQDDCPPTDSCVITIEAVALSATTNDTMLITVDLQISSNSSDYTPTYRFLYAISDQTTTAIVAETPTTITTEALDTNDPVNSSVDPTTVENVTPTIQPTTEGLELWIIIVIFIACVVVVIVITVPVVLCCCRKPNDKKVYGSNPPHELTQGDFTSATPRGTGYIDPSTRFYGGKPAAGLPPGPTPGVQNNGRSPGYLSGPVAPVPVVSDVRDKSRSVYAAQGYENQGYPPPDYDQLGQSHVSRVDVY